MKQFILLLTATVISTGAAAQHKVQDSAVNFDSLYSILYTDTALRCLLHDRLVLLPLTKEEMAALDSAQWAYYYAVKDSFPKLGYNWWANSVYCWIAATYDSLKTVGKYPRAWHVRMRANTWPAWDRYKELQWTYDHTRPSRRRKALRQKPWVYENPEHYRHPIRYL